MAESIDSDIEGNIWISQKAWPILTSGYYHGRLQRIKGNNWTEFRPDANGKYNSNLATVSNSK